MHFRNYLLRTFGIENEYTAIVNADIRLQRDREDKPFGEIVTDRKGKAILRIGQTLTHSPVVRVH